MGMSREILFRGKDCATRRWLYGDLRQWSETRKGICDCELRRTLEVISETVGQYTGLTAKGTKIFEGDVLLVSDTDTAIVEYDETAAMFMAVFGYTDSDYTSLCNQYQDIEIIGNIHDNPELLGGTK